MPTAKNEKADPLREPALFILVAGAGLAFDTQLYRSPSSRAQRSDPWIASSCFVTAFLAASAALLAKTGEENEKAGPDETGSFHFGSGGRIGLRGLISRRHREHSEAIHGLLRPASSLRSSQLWLALLAKTGEENENGPHKGTHSLFGSGGVICTVPTAPYLVRLI